MKLKIALFVMIFIICAGVAYYVLRPVPAPEATSVSQPSGLSVGTEDQIQKALQEMIAKKAEKKSLQTQLALYEKLLKQFPESKDLQHRVDVLQQRIKELE